MNIYTISNFFTTLIEDEINIFAYICVYILLSLEYVFIQRILI